MFTIDALHESFINRVTVSQLSRELFIERAILCGFSQSEIKSFIYSGNSIFDSKQAEVDVCHASYKTY
jgi:hypothetical protein